MRAPRQSERTERCPSAKLARDASSPAQPPGQRPAAVAVRAVQTIPFVLVHHFRGISSCSSISRVHGAQPGSVKDCVQTHSRASSIGMICSSLQEGRAMRRRNPPAVARQVQSPPSPALAFPKFCRLNLPTPQQLTLHPHPTPSAHNATVWTRSIFAYNAANTQIRRQANAAAATHPGTPGPPHARTLSPPGPHPLRSPPPARPGNAQRPAGLTANHTIKSTSAHPELQKRTHFKPASP